MRPYQEGESLYNIVQSALPDFVEADYPIFVEFLKTFLRFLESKRSLATANVYPDYGVAANTAKPVQVTTEVGGPVYEARKLLDYRDIDTTLNEFVSHFLNMFGKDFPNYSYIPADLLVRSLRQFYQNKGTEDSIKWFFRAFFGKDATVYYPRNDILRASDGSWYEPITLKVSAATNRPNDDVAAYYVGQRIITATGSAQVESCNTYVVGQAFGQYVIVNELTLKTDSINGTFLPGQEVENLDSTVIVRTNILPVISDVVVNSGGSHYAVGDEVTFSEGPGLGDGYGAAGEVYMVSSTALNGVRVLNGGDGYLVGLPVSFISTTGTGAAAIVDSVVYGEFLLEDSSGYLMTEDQNSLETDLLCLEDKNTLDLNLLITEFVDEEATVTIDDSDYGVTTGVAQLDGVSIDSTIDYALAAMNEKPFMHPWVFTDALKTTAELANVAATVLLSSGVHFSNGASVFTLTGAQDLTTTNATANVVTGNVIVSDVTTGNGQDVLYLKELANLSRFSLNLYVKQDTGIEQDGTVVLDGSPIIVGNGTLFTQTVRLGSHIKFADDTQAVVKTVVNNTLLVCYTNTSILAANTYQVIPVGLVTGIVSQSQAKYGKIKTVRMLTVGSNYQTPPAVTSESISAEAQELFYFDPANNAIESSNGQVDLYEDAVLQVQQDTGQVTRVKITASGVNYTNANAVVIQALHANGVTGSNASFTPVFGALTRYPGQFLDTKGFLSADKYLQDGEIYNDYTYAVRVDESFDRYKDLLLKILHPAGFSLLDPELEPLQSRL